MHECLRGHFKKAVMVINSRDLEDETTIIMKTFQRINQLLDLTVDRMLSINITILTTLSFRPVMTRLLG